MPPPIRQSDIDACPGALRLHTAADGPLARIRLPGGRLSGSQLSALATIAAEWGDTHLELTSRANIQIRALDRADPAALASRLAESGLLPSPTHEVVRNIAAPPVAEPYLRTLVRVLDRALCADPALAALPGRFLFAIGAVPVAADLAAIPVRAAEPHSAGTPADPPGLPDTRVGPSPSFAILFAGADPGLRVTAAQVVPALLIAARAFLDLRADAPAWRLSELPDGPARVAAHTAERLGTPLAAGPPPEPAAPEPSIGLLAQPDGRQAAGAMVPLGRLTTAQTTVLARAGELVVTPWRGILLPDLSPKEAAGWLPALAEIGLPVEPGSRWSGVTACAGRPGCARSLADVRATATAATRFVDGRPVHWTGCARGCGSPATPHVRVEATPTGWSVTVLDGGGAPATPAGDPGGSGTDRLADLVAAARRR
ncbi:nitrite/sulfite reductase [Paractinoplanes rishiriensis]|uniref:Precorrin-3B synthase n=1 Tax=Paractinoplanes rishiriensis TaxID=1050105 RepID=A0A919JT59_9ACTN|nr:nitrite/sulfite reductase [Actinoplanes rishiriensis]GIE93220.1 precorrin-3B synthase [Actinoplanes rishiriensis]